MTFFTWTTEGAFEAREVGYETPFKIKMTSNAWLALVSYWWGERSNLMYRWKCRNSSHCVHCPKRCDILQFTNTELQKLRNSDYQWRTELITKRNAPLEYHEWDCRKEMTISEGKHHRRKGKGESGEKTMFMEIRKRNEVDSLNGLKGLFSQQSQVWWTRDEIGSIEEV